MFGYLIEFKSLGFVNGNPVLPLVRKELLAYGFFRQRLPLSATSHVEVLTGDGYSAQLKFSHHIVSSFQFT